ncbi:MAG: hypothetical protein ACTSPZ_08240, partial [Promethearchaeota archaeon]
MYSFVSIIGYSSYPVATITAPTLTSTISGSCSNSIASAGQIRSQFLQSMHTLLSITAYFGT